MKTLICLVFGIITLSCSSYSAPENDFFYLKRDNCVRVPGKLVGKKFFYFEVYELGGNKTPIVGFTWKSETAGFLISKCISLDKAPKGADIINKRYLLPPGNYTVSLSKGHERYAGKLVVETY